MRIVVRLALILTLLVGGAVVPRAPAEAQPTTTADGCANGAFGSGALWLICIPSGSAWNRDVVVYAHGYTAFNQPLGFQNLTLPDGSYLPTLVENLGYAFATTSYRQNGLAIREGEQDILDLVEQFHAVCRCAPVHTYLTGVSEGGLVTTQLLEQKPQLFSGGLATCGPIGDFRGQTNYFGDFRVLVDYFFPGVLPPSPIRIPGDVIASWDSTYVPRITHALVAHWGNALQLISTSKAAVDVLDSSTVVTTTQQVLWYNAFATDDAAAKLGGNPYDNVGRWYWGSLNDFRLNASVQRFRADPTALSHLLPYETSGHLVKPLVTLHTTGDDVIPFWQEVRYFDKALAAGDADRLTPVPIFRYGHCAFTTNDVLAAFGLLVEEVTGTQPAGLAQRWSLPQVRRDFARARQDALRKLQPSGR